GGDSSGARARGQTSTSRRRGLGCGPTRPADPGPCRAVAVRYRPVRGLLPGGRRTAVDAAGAALSGTRRAAHWAAEEVRRRDGSVSDEVANAVGECARAAKAAAPSLARASDAAIDGALRDMAR